MRHQGGVIINTCYGLLQILLRGAAETNTLRYIGGIYDTATGLYKLGARYYDPALGRFTQQDPSGQENNPYTYAINNPINASDPSGLASVGSTILGRAIGTAIGIGFGALVSAAASPFITPAGGALLGAAVGGCVSGAISTGTASALDGQQSSGEQVGVGCARGAVTGGWLRAIRI